MRPRSEPSEEVVDPNLSYRVKIGHVQIVRRPRPGPLLSLPRGVVRLGAVSVRVPCGSGRCAELAIPFFPDRVVRLLLQNGLLAARTQADLVYDDLSVSLAAGQVRLTGLRVWPLLQHDEDGLCEIAVDEIALGLPAWGETDRWDLRADLSQLDAPLECLPPPQREIARLGGLDRLRLPHVGIDATYDLGSAVADISLVAAGDEVARLEMDARFDYLWFELNDDDDPVPVAFLDRAVISLQDLGGLEVLLSFGPQALRDPDTAPAFLAGVFETTPLAGDGRSEELRDEAIAAWTAILTGAQTRLELRLEPEDQVYLPPGGWTRPGDMIADLAPSLAAGRVPMRDAIPPVVILAALADSNAVSPADARRIARALLTGDGVPRDRAAATEFLRGRTIEDPDLGLMAAEALLPSDAETAYEHALAAAAGGASGAVSLLDGIEDRIGLAAAIALQPGVEAANGERSMASVRARIVGRGLPRSYAAAGVLARLAAAEGAPGAAAALRRLDRIGLSDPEAWAPIDAAAATRARTLWVDE